MITAKEINKFLHFLPSLHIWDGVQFQILKIAAICENLELCNQLSQAKRCNHTLVKYYQFALESTHIAQYLRTICQ